uniref:uncharacterized protein LOC120347082 n=1 Tax=Styela clava TaxID=7725 RepID=UPI00193ADE0B|nr:uncharacterized protein LOC120347082 [Styela clava]
MAQKYPDHVACVSFNPNFSGRTSEVNLKSSSNVTIINRNKNGAQGTTSLAAVAVGNTDVKNEDGGHIKIIQGSDDEAERHRPSPGLVAELKEVLSTLPDDRFDCFIKKLHDIGIYGSEDFFEIPLEDNSLKGLLPRVQQTKFMRYVESLHKGNANDTNKVVTQAYNDVNFRLPYDSNDDAPQLEDR